jgi:hypothetical protein
MPDWCHGRGQVTETGDLVLALDALVLGKDKEDAEVQADAQATSFYGQTKPETQEDGVHGHKDAIAEEEAAGERVREEEGSQPASVEDADARIQDVLERLKEEGVPVMDRSRIKLGALLGKGAFGTVILPQVALDGADAGCAVKTIVAQGATFNECLTAFETEVKVSWLASQGALMMKDGQRSRICRTPGCRLFRQSGAHQA